MSMNHDTPMYEAPDGSRIPMPVYRVIRELLEEMPGDVHEAMLVHVDEKGDLRLNPMACVTFNTGLNTPVSDAIRMMIRVASEIEIGLDDAMADDAGSGGSDKVTGMGNVSSDAEAAHWVAEARKSISPVMLELVRNALSMRTATGGDADDVTVLGPMLAQTLVTDLWVQACFWGGTYAVENGMSDKVPRKPIGQMTTKEIEASALEYLDEIEGLVYRHAAEQIAECAGAVATTIKRTGKSDSTRGPDIFRTSNN